MRLVLVALNARFSQTNLAIRCLRAAVWQRVSPGDCEVICREFTIHDDIGSVVGDIYGLRPDVVGFSCYIWNIDRMKAVMRRLRLVCPRTAFVCGGPEVSGHSEDSEDVSPAFGSRFLEDNPEVDWAVAGEGEEVFAEFVERCLRDGVSAQELARRFDVREAVSGYQRISDVEHRTLDSWWVDPYTVEEDFSHHYVYLEASRGCPFRCAYCLSARAGVRCMEVEKLAPVLRRLFQWGARTVKLVDRTFNAHPQGMRVLDIFRHEWEKFETELLENGKIEPGAGSGLPKARVHCEMAGDLLSDKWMDYLETYPSGLIQLEIGVQTVHEKTLAAIHRRQDFARWADKAARLQHEMGIPVHLDLIAGLPGEDKAAVLASLERVIRLRPQRLQLGFLKMLKGSPLREEAQRYGIVFSPDAPYEVLRTEAMSFDDLLELRRLEDILDRYYNAGFLRYGLEAMVREFPPFSGLLSALAAFWQERGWFGRQWQRRDLLNNLEPFLREIIPDAAARERCTEALRFDYYAAGLSAQPLPAWLKGPSEERGKCREQQDKEFWRLRLPAGQAMDKRQWARRASVSCFRYNVPDELDAGSELPLGRSWQAGAQDPRDTLYWYLFFVRAGGEVELFPVQFNESAAGLF